MKAWKFGHLGLKWKGILCNWDVYILVQYDQLDRPSGIEERRKGEEGNKRNEEVPQALKWTINDTQAT
jgi:hypothetical protein